MAVFLGRRPDGNFDNFEAAQDCLADLLAALKADGLVQVDLLYTVPGAGLNERTIRRRVPALIGIARYAAIENATRCFTEEDI